MSKKNKVKQNSKQTQRQRPNGGAATRIRQGLDAAARDYAMLLRDPCNARLVAPVYSGMGTGEYRRFRRIISIPSTAMEGTYVFSPSRNTMNRATHIAANAGNPYTFINQEPLFNLPTAYADITELRCLAGCVKVRYTGPEQFRGGVIGVRTLPFNYIRNGQTTNNVEQLSLSPLIHRVGEVEHEVKFVPGGADQTFSAGDPIVISDDMTHGMFGFTFSIPGQAGNLQIEVTAVLEIEAPAGVVPNAMPAASTNTLNHVLTALGPTAKWAYSSVAVPVLKSALNGIVQTATKTGAASAGMAMLTL